MTEGAISYNSILRGLGWASGGLAPSAFVVGHSIHEAVVQSPR